jgi:hypothetical protein
VTGRPCLFITTTTLTAGYLNITDNFWPMTAAADPSLHVQGYVNSICIAIMLVCAVIILCATSVRILKVLTGRAAALEPVEA